MRSLVPGRLRRLSASAFAVCVLSLMVPATSNAAPACPGGDRLPSQLSSQARNATTLCLLNRERAARDLRPLRLDARLGRAALRHSLDMAVHRYFAHDSRSGAGFSARIARTGWMKGRKRWTVGENLARGSGAAGTPRAIVRAWMNSAPHRRNILQPRFRRIGIGIVGLASRPGSDFVYTTDFGS